MRLVPGSPVHARRGPLFGAILSLILLLGAILRFTGLNWDEYQHLHPDERFMTMVETGTKLPDSISQYFDTANSPLNPYNRSFGTFVYGTYPLFLAKFVGAMLGPIGRPIVENLMTEPAGSDFGAYGTLYRVLAEPWGYESIHIIGRFLSGLFDLLTVLVVFFLGRRLYGTRVGLLAAFFLAFSVFNIQQSHFFTVDSFANLPLVLAIWFALDISEGRGGWWSFVLTGAFFGLTLAARINLVTFAGIIALAAVLRLLKNHASDRSGITDLPSIESGRTFGFSTEAVVGSAESGQEEPGTGINAEADLDAPESSARLIQIGPFSFELHSKPTVPKSLKMDESDLEAAFSAREGVETPHPIEATTTRLINFGPISLELETTRRAMPIEGQAVYGEGSPETSDLAWWLPAQGVATGLALAAIAAFLVFRVAQPYAFEGLGLNPKWIQDITSLKDILSGAADYPPGHQWANRADYIFPLQNIVLWGLGLPLGLAAVLGFIIAGWELATRRNWRHLLIFFWVGGTFLYQGQQYVKTMRYSMPLYPFLALFAAYFLVWLWGRATSASITERLNRRTASRAVQHALSLAPRILAGGILGVTAAYTLFWAIAFTSIYTRPVTRVAASHWMIHNMPAGSSIGNEHWDDGLPLRVEGIDPFGGMFRGVTTSGDGLLDMYAEDNPEKRDLMVKWLDVTDYIVLSSNRLYGSITRLPLRYPMTTKYYQALFDGSLGFKEIKTFTSYPQFLGFSINDDNAEEAFTVYDHPKVLIFQKTPDYSHDKFVSILNGFDLTQVYRQTPLNYTISHGAYQLQPQDAADDITGGTWSEIFNPDDIANRVPVPVWFIVIEAIGIIAFPLTFLVFHSFADRGYAFSKPIGILILGWGAWTLASYHLVGFSRENIVIVLFAFILFSSLIAWIQRRDLAICLRGLLPIFILEEVVFVAFFLGFLLIRFGNPDLWHPYFGGEKPMDFAYLNAVIKTTWFPPYNPWFEGGYINYYYFGQLISATLVRLTGVLPEIAYNLLIPMFFAMTALGAYGVAYNLVSGFVSRGASSRQEEMVRGARPGRRAVAAGLLAALFVVIIGNLGEVGVLADGLIKLGDPSLREVPVFGGPLSILSGVAAWLIDRKTLPVPTGNWYWTATRVIPDTINEFPFFTFLYADLHAHLMGLAYTLVALGAAVHAVFVRARFKWIDLGVFALVLGALRAINTWDYPTYLALIGGAMVVGYFAGHPAPTEPLPSAGELLQRYLLFGIVAFAQVMLVVIPTNALGIKVTEDMIAYALMLAFGLLMGLIFAGRNFDPRLLTRALGWRFMALIVLSVIVYYPFIANYGTAYTSVELWKDQRTSLLDYMVVHAIFLFMVVSFLILENLHIRDHLRSGAQAGSGFHERSIWDWVVYAVPGLVVFEIVLLVLGLQVFSLVFPISLLALWLLLRPGTRPEARFIALLTLAALAMTLVVEVITLKGDIGRMNTVFKFYLQGWVLFGISSAAGLALIADRILPVRRELTEEQVQANIVPFPTIPMWRQAWVIVLSLLLVAGLLYPVFATWAKVNDRFVADSPPGLNGLDYMVAAKYNVNNQDLALIEDLDAIRWMRGNIRGSPVVAEASYELYRWNDRVSINTGLPTIVGWDWHTKQQYSLIDGSIIDQRKQDVADLYNTADPITAAELIKRYDVSYVYVGPLEKALYDAEGLSKFEAMSEAGVLAKVYDSSGVQIYRVNSAASAMKQ